MKKPYGMSFFPNPRRVVTGHDQNGNAIFVADSRIPCLPVPVNCNFAVLYETHDFPVSNDEWHDPIGQRTEDLANNDGIVLRCVDFKPNTETVRRRSFSIPAGSIAETIIRCSTVPNRSILVSS